MNLLLDSHTLLWLMQANPTLSGTAAGLIADSANRLYLSMASIWEIAIKSGLGKMGLSVPYATFLDTARLQAVVQMAADQFRQQVEAVVRDVAAGQPGWA